MICKCKDCKCTIEQNDKNNRMFCVDCAKRRKHEKKQQSNEIRPKIGKIGRPRINHDFIELPKSKNDWEISDDWY